MMPGTKQAALRRTARTVERLLDRAYGPRAAPEPSDPLDALIGTILSQNTSDVNSRRAYDALRAAYPTWEEVMAVPRARLERVLRPGGLAKTKSARIQRILRSIARDGALSLDDLSLLPADEAERRLLTFDGVGLKTARCVLLFALGRDAFPIDTHIHRVLMRIGIIPEGMTAEKAHAFVPPLIPKARCYAFHVNLIAHGRQVCRPRTPACTRCPVRLHCAYGAGMHDTGT
ncbi:MAG: endonuclease III [Candidatus Hydrogenedentes bacterium]|nr:endonuclease III [Candidatus Hydrogenedentota bacterium]